MSLVVRPAVVDDADGIARVQVLAWQGAYRGIMPAEFLDTLSVDERAADARTVLSSASSGRATLVGLVDDRIAGFIAVGWCRDDSIATEVSQLWALNVEPDAWGIGLGDLLISAGTEQLRSFGRPEAVLWVVEANARARRFYERHGWTADDASQALKIPGAPIEVRYERIVAS